MNTDISTVMARALPHEQLPLPEAEVHTYQRFCLCQRCRSVRETMTEEGKRLDRANELARRLQKVQQEINLLVREAQREVFDARSAVERSERLEQEAREASVRG